MALNRDRLKEILLERFNKFLEEDEAEEEVEGLLEQFEEEGLTEEVA